jgi:murein DD-endopeptidase MepM/ murein hydrolase activator NlpD
MLLDHANGDSRHLSFGAAMKNVMILASALALSVSPLSGEALRAQAAPHSKTTHSASKTQAEGTYRVVSGDTVEAIAKRFDMSQADLIALNDLKKPYRLALGKVMKVTPAKSAKTSSRIDAKADQASKLKAKDKGEDKGADTGPSTYKVAKGDTIGGIANRKGISQADLIEFNGLKKPYALKLGQVLILTEKQSGVGESKAKSSQTEPKASETKATIADSPYKVAKGDTVGLIAKRLKVSQDDIIALNDLKKPYALSLGKVLKIPGSADTKPSLRSEAKSATVAEAPETYDSYKVVKGDTVAMIAKRLKVSQSEIIALNGLKKPYALTRGKILKVPGSGVSPAKAEADASPPIEISTKSYSGLPKHVQGGKGTYKVVKGDTVASVAKRLGMDRDDLIQMNGLKKPYALTKGRVLKVPAPMVYEVQRGDTYSDIANRFDVSVSDLTKLNKTSSSKGLRPGQKIKLPPEVQVRLAKKAEAAERAAQQAAADRAEAVRFEAEQEIIRREAARLANERALAAKRAADEAAAAQPFNQPMTSSTPTVLPPKPVPNGTSVAPARVEPRPIVLPPAPSAGAETGVLPTEAEIIASGRGRFLWPVRGDVISGFGIKPGGQRNDGINLSGKDGDPVRAAAGGEVVYSGNLVPGFGNLVLIKHEGGWVTAYAHMASASVKIKDRIAQGQTIGTVGRTGGVEASQLHFELRYAPSPKEKARPIDPALVMPR